MSNYYIGLLSGTSVDSIDAALMTIDEDNIDIVCTHEQNFSAQLKSELQNIIKSQSITLEQLSNTDSLLAFEFSQAIDILISKSNITKSKIIAIGSHGQTIYHQPNGNHTNTIQIGSAHMIAAITGIKVVNNFRNLDMAYGGQGAPLAPLIHKRLFANNDKNTAVINLGGIANISFIGKDYPHPIGFDVGPANCLIDEWIHIHKNLDFDEAGNWAKQGQLNKTLLSQMLNDDFFHKPVPKSTGREYFNHHWYDNFIEQFKLTQANDIQTTLTHLVAASIANTIKLQQYKVDEMILIGGGAKNSYLVNLISQYSSLNVTNANNYGYDGDWIEAILFAFLAYKRINNTTLDLNSFTGSSKPILIGDIVEC